MSDDQKLYSTIFPDSNQNTINSVPYFIRDFIDPHRQVHCSAYSNELLVLGHNNHVRLIDVVTRNFNLISVNTSTQGCIVTSVSIGYFNNVVLIGTQKGKLIIYMLSNQLQQYIIYQEFEIKNFCQTQIQNIFITDGELIITIDLSCIKLFYANQLKQLVEKQIPSKENKYQIHQQEIECIIEEFPVGICSSVYCYETNQLIVALGDSSIRVYTFIGEDINLNIKQFKQYLIEEFEVISKISISNDGRLLAVAQCKLINSSQYRISIMDLKRKGKVIKKYSYNDAADVVDMKFFPIQNKLFVVNKSGYIFVIDIDLQGDERFYLTNLNGNTKQIYPMSQYQEFPNLLQIEESGVISILTFDSPKSDLLLQIPFLYYVELKLAEVFDYKPLLQYYFQTSYQQGFLGIDKKNQQVQQIMLNGEQYFEPLYDGIIKMSEYKQFYRQEFMKKMKQRKKLIEFPLWILTQQQSLKEKNRFDNQKGPIQLDLKKVDSEKVEKRQSKQKKKLNFVKIEQFFDTAFDTDKKLYFQLGEAAEQALRQYQEMHLSDDRYLLIMKLLKNIQYQNLTMVLLGNCSILFDVKFKFKDYIFDMINKIDRLQYLDLSNNNITLEDIKKISRLTALKFLDLSNNHLGNQQKKPMQKQKMRYQNLENIDDEILKESDDFLFYKQIFSKVPIINLRNNNYTDEEGAQLLAILVYNEDFRVIDLSGNLNFQEQTRLKLQYLIDEKSLYLKNPQTLIIEFNESISEISMKSFAKQIIEKYHLDQPKVEQIPINEEQIPAQMQEEIQMNFFLYIVNSNQNYYWDQSLLQLYEKQDEGKDDEIKSCVYGYILVFVTCFTNLINNIKDNIVGCFKQCFCSIFFIRKYFVCGYCVFLQSEYGSFITHLLGIKTAEYEYNNKKDDLKKYLENSKYYLNVLFWINFLAFYFICVFVPTFFVLACQGHQWTGHFIYCGYALLVSILEIRLARICIQHQITHHEFSTGPLWRRFLFFIKDIILSQMAKFDVYSDICFITTVMTCGDNLAIGICAICIMALTLGTTMFHILRLLLGRQNGNENYIDYLCNYCSFVEMHLIGSLLEKWTIQNTTDFLWMEGIPNRVYAATFRTFAEDLPQFLLQVIYLFLNPNKKSIEILMLSLASSTVSIIVSITKSLTITKANKIDDKIMMNEVKNKLGLTKEITDKQLNEDLIQFLHDYYQNFDGEEFVQFVNYGMTDTKHYDKSKDPSHNLRAVAGQKQTVKIQKGISLLVEQPQQQKQLQKNPTQIQGQENLEFFEPYLFFMNSAQVKLIYKLFLSKQIKHQQVAQVLLELEVQDYVEQVPIFQNEKEVYQFKEGSFIESLDIQILILDQLFDFLQNSNEKKINILDLGCGTGFTATAILKLCEKLKPKDTYQILCIDHIPDLLKKAKSIIELGYEDFLENKLIEFQEFDCTQNLMSLGQFDIVNYGYAVSDVDKYLIKADGIAIIPIIKRPQEHEYHLFSKQEDLLKTLGLESQSGTLITKELQFPDIYQYYEIQRGEECSICQERIGQSNQFYSPWLRSYYCIKCGQIDDEESDIKEFKILSNLIFIPSSATSEELRRLSSYKFGHNLFPKKDQDLQKYHSIDCHPCSREKGDENEFPPQPRYICLNCRPGKFDGSHVDICYDCAQCFIDDELENQREQKLYYLSGHAASHLLLKIHFYYDYNYY